ERRRAERAHTVVEVRQLGQGGDLRATQREAPLPVDEGSGDGKDARPGEPGVHLREGSDAAGVRTETIRGAEAGTHLARSNREQRGGGPAPCRGGGRGAGLLPTLGEEPLAPKIDRQGKGAAVEEEPRQPGRSSPAHHRHPPPPVALS